MAVQKKTSAIKSNSKHLLGIQNLSILEAKKILEEAKAFILLNRSPSKKLDILRGKTQINLFFEPSTRTQSSFDLAGKRLGADVMTMNVSNSALKKGETLMDTAMTLNAMHPDIIVIRHQDSGACNLLSQKVNCAVLNAGDGSREHPTQALLDALTIINRKKKIEVPLIPNTIFVETDLKSLNQLYTIPGFHSILKFLGKPALVRQDEINNLKLLLQDNIEIEKEDFQEFKKGESVEVIHGPLQGIIATSIDEGRTHKLIVEIESMEQRFIVHIPKSYVRKIGI